MWKLVIKDEEGRTAVVPLKKDEYVLGRRAGTGVRLAERNVSREHAKLSMNPGGGKLAFMIQDLTSDNGTLVNGIRLAGTKGLTHGDLIQIGDYRIVLQDDAEGEVVVPSAVPDEPEYDP